MKKNVVPSIHNQSGFTLLEILISITILLFLMLGVYYLTENSTSGKDRTLKEDKQKIQIEAAMHRIDQDFSKIYNPLFYKAAKQKKTNRYDNAPQETEEFPPFEVTERFPIVTKDNQPIPAILNETKSELVFLSTVNQRKVQNTKESHYVWIKYLVRNNTDEDKNKDAPLELVRYYQASDIYAPEFDFDNIKPAILLQNIKKLEFKFWNKDKEKFVDRIKDLPNANILRAMQIELTVLDNNNNEMEFTRTFKSIWPYFDPQVDEADTNNKTNNVGSNDKGIKELD